MDILDQEKYFKTRDAMMCERWRDSYKKNLFNDIKTQQVAKGDYKVSGVLKYDLAAMSVLKPLYIQYWAAAPANHLTSFTGSGRPFSNEDIAFENTPNKGVAMVVNGNYSFFVHYPNAYYTHLGTKYVAPSVHLQVVDDVGNVLSPVYTIKLGNGTPYRHESGLGAPKKIDKIQSQWKNLVDNQYPKQN